MTSELISSRHNPRFKAALALREPRERRARGLVLVDGAREIGRALDAGAQLVEAWVAPEQAAERATAGLLPGLAAAGAIVETTPELLARLAYGARDEGLVAIFEEPPAGLDGLMLPERPLVAVVERVEKPGNLGALLRSADGAGVDAVIVADPVSDVWSANAIRASLATIFSLSLAVCRTDEAIGFLRDQGIRIAAAWVDGEDAYDAVDYRESVAIVVGSENAGLSAAWRGPGMLRVRIPMLGSADSLNVAASAAILLYEARRQRGSTPGGGSATWR